MIDEAERILHASFIIEHRQRRFELCSFQLRFFRQFEFSFLVFGFACHGEVPAGVFQIWFFMLL